MINSKAELKEYLKYEKERYKEKLNINFFDYITRKPIIYIWKYQKLLRKSEYYRNTGKFYHKPFFVIERLRKNMLGKNISIDIGDNSCEKGLLIYHPGIVINGYARIGENFECHGTNCIGNNGLDIKKCPVIGNNAL